MIEQVPSHFVGLAQDLVTILLQVSFLLESRPDPCREVTHHLAIVLGSYQIRQSVSRFDVFLRCHHLTIQFSGLWMLSFSLTQTILLKTSLSSSGSSFVLTFELHDSSLNGFLDTALFSSSSLPCGSCCSRFDVPEEGSVCSSLSWFLIFSSANIMQRLSWSSPLFSESSSHSSDSRTNSLPHCLLLFSITPLTLDLVRGIRFPP